MKPIDESELSAYLDDELDPKRTAQVRAALADDEKLAAQLDAFRAVDEAWREAAVTARFAPDVRLVRATAFWESWKGIAVLSTLLVALRWLPSVTGLLEWGLAIHAAALALVLVWTARRVTEAGSISAARKR